MANMPRKKARSRSVIVVKLDTVEEHEVSEEDKGLVRSMNSLVINSFKGK